MCAPARTPTAPSPPAHPRRRGPRGRTARDGWPRTARFILEGGAFLCAVKLKSGVDSRFISKVSCVAVLLAVGFGCRTGPPRAPVIAEAYVGPAILNIRSDIPLDSKPV